MDPRNVAPILVGLITALAAACSEPATSGCRPMAEDVDVVESRGTGRWAERGVEPRLRELWRRGGTREGEMGETWVRARELRLEERDDG